MDDFIYQVRVFCRDQEGGNQAGVMLLKETIPTEKMQQIAADLGFSETIFLVEHSDKNYTALFFTPTSPIDFCGHASIAAFGVLQQIKGLKKGKYVLNTQVGSCEVTLNDLHEDSRIFLRQIPPQFGQVIPKTEIAEALNIDAKMIFNNAQIVSTGLKDIIVPIQDKKTLFSIIQNEEKVIALCKKYDVIGLHLFALEEASSPFIAYCRNFAPLYGIPEESATGSSNGALGCYLYENNITKETCLMFKQGDLLNLPSDIYVRITIANNKIDRVECGGNFVLDLYTGIKK